MDLMNRVCKPYLDKFVIVFIDDILIYSHNEKEHEEHLKTILELLKKEELYAKFSKCEFWINTVKFLGHMIDSSRFHVGPQLRLMVFKNWASPTNSSEIRPFLEQEEAFQLLKQQLCAAPILALPEGSEDFVVYCDASIKGLGVVLMQRMKMFTATRVYQQYPRQKDLNMRQHRWIELLSDYDCEIRYHPGKANVVADALSRKERIEPLRVRALVMTIGLDLPSRILEAHKEVVKVENIEAEDIEGVKSKLEARTEEHYVGIIRVGYMLRSRDKMYHDVKDVILWPNMRSTIATMVREMPGLCLGQGMNIRGPSGLLVQPNIPEWKWEKITMDFITKLPKTVAGFDSIWVIVDRLTKSAHFLPIRETNSTEKLTRLYMKEIVARHGIPVSIISGVIAIHFESVAILA
ncbi:putative reverse transcriptase domain-containing protein [Tanacetum coccineum]